MKQSEYDRLKNIVEELDISQFDNQGAYREVISCIFKTFKAQEADEGPRILDEKQVMRLIPFSRSTLWRMQKRGDFPLRRKFSPGRVGWAESEIQDWIQNYRTLYGNSYHQYVRPAK